MQYTHTHTHTYPFEVPRPAGHGFARPRGLQAATLVRFSPATLPQVHKELTTVGSGAMIMVTGHIIHNGAGRVDLLMVVDGVTTDMTLTCVRAGDALSIIDCAAVGHAFGDGEECRPAY